jgi:hypothetical protein
MMSELWLTVSKAIEHLGLDWFALLIGKSAFEDAPLPYPATLSEVRKKFGDLRDKEKLDDAIEYCGSLLKREEDRSDKIESKAFTLIGITGIATGFITGFAGLLLDRGKITSTWVLKPAAVLYILVVISLMWTIYLAVKVVIVGDYRFTYPSANDIFDLSNATLNHVKRERAASLFYSFAQNVQVVNRKATYLGGAQLWFRNSIVLLLVLTLLLAVCAPLMPTSVSGVPTPPMGSSPTVQPTRAPTDTPQATPMPTGTPTRTPTSTPTCTPTATPTAIVQSSPTVTATLSP